MPIYEYRCQSCNHELEAMQKLSDPELSDCPTCGKPGLKKLISAVGFRLKGSGWYETDFKKGGAQKNVAKEDSAPKESKESSSGGAGDGAGGCGACPAPAAT
ncbi:MAG TPA: zinc ribbon domain-containing protein [Candidatus Competibacter sp.]|nr:FmdB family transcriptional regulator [Candidatus Competibacteraceae bacterium]HRE54193.1 zinc ribbon domain-containing protein [Candidatus Competibacter sp.]HUM95412.1 zinc ribbon domain-containing protein [Candidatus Competibacter sp.]